MVRAIGRFVSYVALASMGVMVSSLAALAVSTAQPTPQHFKTAIVSTYGSPYPITGVLDLQIFPNGILRGYYHTSYYKLYIPVTGGTDGDYIWFDIGPSSVDLGLGAGPDGKLHVVATMGKDGSFRGQVYPESAASLPTLSEQYQINPVATNVGVPAGTTPATAGGGKRAPASTSQQPSTGVFPAPGPATVSQGPDQPDQYIFTATLTSEAEATPTP